MNLRIFKQDCLDNLKRMSLNERRNWYQKETPWLSEYFQNQNYFHDTKIELPERTELVREGEPSKTDLENSIRIYEALGGEINSVQAAEERLWSFLCHETYWDYMMWRWPPEKEGTIKTRYFLEGAGSRALSRNGIARLWWFAYLTYDQQRDNHYELTAVLMRHQDIQHNLIERNFGRNRDVLHAILEFLKRHPEADSKEDYVRIGKCLNRLGGVKVLDCMEPAEIICCLESKLSMSKT